MNNNDNQYERLRKRNELIGMVTATISAVCMVLCKMMRQPVLMYVGFAFWIFAGAFTVIQLIKARKTGQRPVYVRIFMMMILAILMLFFIQPSS